MPESAEKGGASENLEARIRELEAANTSLSRHNEQLAQFVNILANDLRSPLRHIMGFCRIVKHEFGKKLGPRGISFLDNAVVSARRIRQLVDDLVTIARVQREKFEPKPLKLDEIMNDVRTTLDASIRETDAAIVHGRLPRIKGNPELIRILMQNLVDNAIKFRGHKRPSIHVNFEPAPGGWHIWVSDNGSGIAKDRHELIFDAFQRSDETHSAYGASGLGLFICKEIVERHGGKIWLESEVGKGTTFHFTTSDESTG